MSRTTTFYLVTLGLCGGGLWLILAAGAKLTPPTDLSGRWHIDSPHEDPSEDTQPTPDGQPDRLLLLRQSGQFLALTLPGKPLLNLRHLAESTSPAGVQTITFTNPTQHLLVKLHPAPPTTRPTTRPETNEAAETSEIPPRQATFSFSGRINQTLEATLLPPPEHKPSH